MLDTIFAQDCGADLDCQISQIQREIDALSPAHEKNKTDLAGLKKQIADLTARIGKISTQLKNTESEIRKREEDLAFAQKVFDQKAMNQYIQTRSYDTIFSIFLSSENVTDAFREISLKKKAMDEDRKLMERYINDLLKLKSDKESLEKNKVTLASAQKSINEKATFLQGEVDKVEKYLGTLSAKQQEIINAKSGNFITSVGDIELADDPKASIKGFRESAPSGSFAVFVFGGYTHRKGMSQYGARGRAQNGQKADQILNAYYSKSPIGRDTSGSISVGGGVGSIDFETIYLYGIAEMPSSWHTEALKAQAIAARSYGYRYKKEGKTICIDEGCQVFSYCKATGRYLNGSTDSSCQNKFNSSGPWRAAVDATRGQILEDVTTYYSSTSGGYLATMGWDTTNGGGGSDFIDRAYEKLGGSPWLYKSWYRYGYTSTGATCGGQEDPWLNNEEFTDIVNAAVILKNGSDDRVVPVTTSCPGFGGNPYSYSELRQKGGINSVTSVTVTQGNGVTTNVNINGNINLTGLEFKQAFNARAPGYLKMPQGLKFGSSVDFAFFNIEKK